MGIPDDVTTVLDDFIIDLNKLVSTHRLEELLNGDGDLESADIGSKPEAWTRQHLIRPLLDAANITWENEIHGRGQGYPDFGISNLDLLVIGEDKPINNVSEAEADIKDYLNNRAASRGAEYGIATDGIEWKIIRIELGGDYLDYDEVATIDFRQTLLAIARDHQYISQTGVTDIDTSEEINRFADLFERDALNQLLTQDAPKQIRAQKKAGIKEFYDLYVELLFGEGAGDYEYETTLLDDITAPSSTTETDNRKFAIKLVNRLLFVKFLEDRGVLPNNFLSQRVDDFQAAENEVGDLGGSLYKTQLEPLFFSLFNTEQDARISNHRGSWFDDVPYLNGSLFAPTERERDYDVDDRMLITTVTDLIEGHELNNKNGDESLDPSVIGNVFEMTINHISGGQSQQSEGAYYTPSDVIRLITQQSVDPKIYDIMVDVYSTRLANRSNIEEEQAEDLVTEYDLGEMLRKVEQREGYFSDPQAIEEAYDRLGELKIIDPACGSGHFLTGVLDEIHRVRVSLLRGLQAGNVSDEDLYQAKKDLVLNTIYGVDVNPIAIEIAKLRVWLKMVEEGWESKFGRLPNIDVNIVDGNSLIGLPKKTTGQPVIQSFNVDLGEIESVRDAYREGNINRKELDAQIEALKPELREIYANKLTHYFEDEIVSTDVFNEIVDGLDKLYPTVESVRVRRSDGENLTETDIELLDSEGFQTYKKSARMSGQDVTGNKDVFRSLLDSHFNLEIERRPTVYDLKQLEQYGELSHHPFHWIVEFPEAVVSNKNGNGHSVEFDIVVGNPPYGDLVTDVEHRFTSGYKTGKIRDIAAQFLERELQLLGDEGYFGNITTLRLIYDGKAYISRDILNSKLAETRVACFGWRPSHIFAGSEALAAIITGVKAEDIEDDLTTSRFILFNDDDRKNRLENIAYGSCNGLVLGDTIGGGELGESSDKGLPKVGNDTARSVLESLRDVSGTTIRDREVDRETEHVVWRKEGARYWVNPLLESFWSAEDRSRETKPMYFDTELERYTVFLLLQSSMFYNHYMVYGDQQHVSWKLVRSFPFPDIEELQEHEDEIERLAKRLWSGMEQRFHPDINVSGEIQGVAELKPVVDAVDELLGPILGLSEDEVAYVKQLDTEYGRAAVEEEQEHLSEIEIE